MEARKVMMECIRNIENEVLKSSLKIDLMEKASQRFEKRGESLKANIAKALIRNEKNQKTYCEGILTGYRLSLTLLKRRG